ncbi:MAG: GTP cyclohydrolase II [Candidatus Heimdallarchaeaceae archaeon]
MGQEIEKLIRKKIDELGLRDTELIHFGSLARLPTRFGEFEIMGVLSLRDMKEHTVLIKGKPYNLENIPLRIHSECLTGDAFTSLRCDCREQLEYSLEYLAKEENAILIYLRQEGRGIGLFNKLKTYTLQEIGYDTYEANKLLGFKADERTYSIAVDILEALKIKSVRLMTNNPKKVAELCNQGITVIERIPIQIPPNTFNEKYLETKFNDGHLLGNDTYYCQDEREEKN